MPSKKLDLELSDDETIGLNVKNDYAENYEKWRRKEELQRIKNKYGDDALNDEESDADSESSEEPLTWSAQDERNFFSTLGALKAKNPKIYDGKTTFFDHEQTQRSTVPESLSKPKKQNRMTLRDYEERLVTERDGRFSDEDDEEKLNSDPSYNETQAKLKDDLKRALNGFSNEEDGLLTKRVKTDAERKEEEADYLQWLKGQKDELNGDIEDLRNLKQKWTGDELDDGEKFLRDYLLNKRYDTDHVETTTGLPTYDEIVREDEEEEKRTQFEVKYNFRYEDPDQEFIKQFPRTIKESVRQTDTTRKEARDRRKLRKEEEKQQKREEIKQLKSMKKSEIEEKLRKLREITGDESLPLSINDLQTDFDPAEYDKRMKDIFTNDYYENAKDDEVKPVFSDMSDVEYEETDEEEDEETVETTERIDQPTSSGNQAARARNHKRNSRFTEMIKQKKPEFDPNQKSLQEYLNEYYALDYEDIIADNLRTKFRYRQVEPNAFGLSTDEILALDDAQLNAWVSVKKVTAYKSAEEDRLDRMVYERKAENPARKQKVFSSITPKTKKKQPVTTNTEPSNEVEKPVSGKRKKQQRKLPSAMDLGTERLHAYGVSVPKLKTALHGKNKRKRRGGKKKNKSVDQC
ncbi:Protein KRI1-like protein [Aphelenchoides besseyi]|nr:Protein KRI1-like protein [Aphelenchoides besseyi]